jgi:di/tripeptidase
LSKNHPPEQARKAAIEAASKTPPQENLSDDELKSRDVKRLVERYAIFHRPPIDDPYGLAITAEKYKENPNHEALKVERRAQTELLKTQDENQTLECECTDLAVKVKNMLKQRKMPFTIKEVVMKKSSLLKEVEDQSKILAGLRDQFKRLIDENQKIQSDIETTNNKLKDELAELDARVIKTEQETRDLEKTWQTQDHPKAG